MNTSIELIIDFSLSMGSYNQGKYLLPDGNTRMSLAKDALINVIIPILDYTGHMGIRTFYSKEKNPVINPVYDGKFETNNILSKIQSLGDPIDTGGTPISAALQASIDFLKKADDIDKKIILITDGEENEGSDFKVTIENSLKTDDIDYSIFIIGIGQNAITAAKCKLLAESTKGEYVNLETINYDKEKLKNILSPLSFKAVSSSISNIQESNLKVIGAIVNKTDSNNKEIEKKNEINEELIRILTGHAHSIELFNKQFINLDGTLRNIEKSITAINSEISNRSFSSSTQILVKSIEENRLDSMNKVYNKIDQVDKGIKDFTQVAVSLNFGNLVKALDKKINLIKVEMSEIHKSVEIIEANTTKQLSKLINETRFFQTLFLIALITIGILAYVVLSK